LTGPTEQFLRSMCQIRSLGEEERQQIAAQVFAEIEPLVKTFDLSELRQLRRRFQDERALLIYEGARDFSDARYAVAVLIEQWAIGRAELITARSLITKIFAERRCKAIEDFVRDNLTG
jgi:hypothetical protein